MKVQTAIIALAITAATVNAAPVELEERGSIGKFFGKADKPGGDKPGGTPAAGTPEAAPAPGAYNKDSAGRINAGMGLGTNMGLLAMNGMATDTTNQNQENQQQQKRQAKLGRTQSAPARITNDKNPPAAAGGAATNAGKEPPKAATSSDYMGTAAGAFGMANLGMGLYNADQANQAAHDAAPQKRLNPAVAGEVGLGLMMGGGPSVGVTNSNYQEAGNGNVHASGAHSGRRSLMADELLSSDGFQKRLNPAVAGQVGLGMLMGGGPSVGVTKSNSQYAGNGNMHMSGAKSRRQLQEESEKLQRRLFSFNKSDYNQQTAGNGNVHASGASSGGVPSNADKLMASMQAGAGAPQQKRDEGMAKRLFSFSHTDSNQQNAGNGNVHASGASSGGVPSNADNLMASMQAGAGRQGGGAQRRALMRRLINVSTSDQNQQVAGNGNVHMSGAKSGASPQFLASLNPATAGGAY